MAKLKYCRLNSIFFAFCEFSLPLEGVSCRGSREGAPADWSKGILSTCRSFNACLVAFCHRQIKSLRELTLVNLIVLIFAPVPPRGRGDFFSLCACVSIVVDLSHVARNEISARSVATM